MTVAPHLVTLESDPVQFLRYCKYNVYAAAERLVLYWEERLNAFGCDRAYLPLNQTGNGALTSNDVAQLKKGFLAVLPSTRTGAQVLYCNPRHDHRPIALPEVGKEDFRYTTARCFFYVANVMAKDSRAQLEGVFLLVLLVMPHLRSHDASFLEALSLAKQVLPIKFTVHILGRIPKRSSECFVVIGAFVSKLIEAGFDPVDTEVHIEREEGHILDELMRSGLAKSCVPACLGGSWYLQDFLNWCTNRWVQELVQIYNDRPWSADSLRGAAADNLVGSAHGEFAAPVASSAASSANTSQQHPLATGITGYPGTARQQQHGTNESIILEPQPNDILMGKGMFSWSGNRRFHNLICRHAMSYDAAPTRVYRMKIVSTIAETVRSWEGHFLDPSSSNDDGASSPTEVLWTRATIPRIRKKIGQALRYRIQSLADMRSA